MANLTINESKKKKKVHQPTNITRIDIEALKEELSLSGNFLLPIVLVVASDEWTVVPQVVPHIHR